MREKSSKMFISIMSVLMICLIASTATTTVAAGDWGNLEVGDIMEWKLYDPWMDIEGSLKMEILDISGSDITSKYELKFEDEWGTYGESGTEMWEDQAMLVYSQTYLQEMKTNAEDDPEETWTTTNHDWQGNSYKTHYIKWTSDGDRYETWIDQGAGICLEIIYSHGGTTYTTVELQSTTADLTEAGGICFGTILIAFVSVATLVTYSLVRYQKKK